MANYVYTWKMSITMCREIDYVALYFGFWGSPWYFSIRHPQSENSKLDCMEKAIVDANKKYRGHNAGF